VLNCEVLLFFVIWDAEMLAVVNVRTELPPPAGEVAVVVHLEEPAVVEVVNHEMRPAVVSVVV